jgi:hypothetical protein
MRFLWGAKRLGVLTSRGFPVKDGNTVIHDDEVKQFKLYGVVVGMWFIGVQRAKYIWRNDASNDS